MMASRAFLSGAIDARALVLLRDFLLILVLIEGAHWCRKLLIAFLQPLVRPGAARSIHFFDAFPIS
jgi:hypothetical protein